MAHHTCIGETLYPGQHLFTCPDCDYRMVLTTRPVDRLVIDSGDDNATHSGSVGSLTMSATVSGSVPCHGFRQRRPLDG